MLVPQKYQTLAAAIYCVVLAYVVGLAASIFPAAQLCEADPYRPGTEDCALHYIVHIPFIYVAHRLDNEAPLIAALATIAIAAFTWRLFWATAQLRQSSDNLWRTTKEQHASANRAFVFVRHFITIPTGANAGIVDFWRIIPVIENTGNTPTKHYWSFHSAALRDTPLPEDFDFPDTQFPPHVPQLPGRTLLGPHAQVNGTIFILPIADILAIQQQTKFFYVWGWMDYNDVFEGTRQYRTEYCYRAIVLFDPTNHRNTNAVGMMLHGRHNGADDECLRQPQPHREEG